MNKYLHKWIDNLVDRESSEVDRSCTVQGERNKHLGPMWQFARVEVSVEPSEQFEVADLVEPRAELAELGYPDWVVFGILDVLMIAESAPVKNVRITLRKADHHPIDSSPMAFRQAGRDAGRKILDALLGYPRQRETDDR